MKKRFLKLCAMILAVSMVFTMAPLSMYKAYAEDSVTTTLGGVVYTINEDDKTAAVSSYTDALEEHVTIPETVVCENKTYTVTSIGDNAFIQCAKMKSITLPDRLEIIGMGAFRYGALRSITIPASVTSLGDSAFQQLSELTTVTFEEGCSITTIEAGVFRGCKNLESIEIPANVTNIKMNAFNGCESFESVIVPEKVTSIGKWAFRRCIKMTTITIPASVTAIDGDAFEAVPLATINFGGSKAQWDAITGEGKPTIDNVNYGAFTVTFLDGQGNTLKTETVKRGNAATAPAKPARKGYTFNGWDKGFNNVTTDLTVTAKWKKNAIPPQPPKPISIKGAKVVLSAASFTYNGKVRKPYVKTVGGKALKAGTDFTVKWSNASSKNVGAYTVTITGKGKYTGTTKAAYRIDPAGTDLRKVKKAKKAVTVKWKKQKTRMSKSRITGYQIQLATDKKFTKNKKNVIVKGYKKISKKVRKLKGKTKYYIRIRTFKTIKGVKYYSPWSGIKTVRIR